MGLVDCTNCGKRYYKDNRHINENLKLRSNFYCSPLCLSLYKTKKVKCICDNLFCKKEFTKTPAEIGLKNYCSQSCAAKVNNKERARNRLGINGFKRHPIRLIERKILISPIIEGTPTISIRLGSQCQKCKAPIKSNKKFCSMKCWADTYRISRTTLLSNLIQFTERLGRTPTRREYYQSTTCAKEFGSWTKCLIAAGLTPHRSLNQKMYKRRICKASDGHICNSVSESIIDNWLFDNKIQHEKEVLYPIGKYSADWKIDQKTFVEYFGLAHDSKIYDEEIIKKRSICKEYGIKLIEIYSWHLFPKNHLSEIIIKK